MNFLRWYYSTLRRTKSLYQFQLFFSRLGSSSSSAPRKGRGSRSWEVSASEPQLSEQRNLNNSKGFQGQRSSRVNRPDVHEGAPTMLVFTEDDQQPPEPE
ncbi:hypothetical protein KQX54_021582 [Cotesia glomerata]|uniref:Uncharacterized protein n=1 Tax=Cotesia glomerata TaxID=32391 RepID=A0AAV7J8X4_COTGL|nr:hypothetical protein KQX54_021582 [Cotesia glomerata]